MEALSEAPSEVAQEQAGKVHSGQHQPEGQAGKVHSVQHQPEGQAGKVYSVQHQPEGQAGSEHSGQHKPEGQAGKVHLEQHQPENQASQCATMQSPQGKRIQLGTQVGKVHSPQVGSMPSWIQVRTGLEVMSRDVEDSQFRPGWVAFSGDQGQGYSPQRLSLIRPVRASPSPCVVGHAFYAHVIVGPHRQACPDRRRVGYRPQPDRVGVDVNPRGSRPVWLRIRPGAKLYLGKVPGQVTCPPRGARQVEAGARARMSEISQVRATPDSEGGIGGQGTHNSARLVSGSPVSALEWLSGTTSGAMTQVSGTTPGATPQVSGATLGAMPQVSGATLGAMPPVSGATLSGTSSDEVRDKQEQSSEALVSDAEALKDLSDSVSSMSCPIGRPGGYSKLGSRLKSLRFSLPLSASGQTQPSEGQSNEILRGKGNMNLLLGYERVGRSIVSLLGGDESSLYSLGTSSVATM